MKTEPKWWAAPGDASNHNYVLRLNDYLDRLEQFCHLCGELEPPLRQPTGDERTDRAAMHLVHGVRAHLNTTAKEWNQ